MPDSWIVQKVTPSDDDAAPPTAVAPPPSDAAGGSDPWIVHTLTPPKDGPDGKPLGDTPPMSGPLRLPQGDGSFGDVAGGVLRAAAPYAAEAVLGAGMGGPVLMGGALLGGQAADILSNLIQASTGYRAMSPRMVTDKILDQTGLPSGQDSSLGRLAGALTEGTLSAVSGGAGGRALAGAASPIARKVGKVLSESPTLSAVGGAAGGVAGQTYDESNDAQDPLGRMLVEMGVGSLAGVPTAHRLLSTPPTARELAVQLEKEGAFVPPTSRYQKPGMGDQAKTMLVGSGYVDAEASNHNVEWATQKAKDDLEGFPKDKKLTRYNLSEYEAQINSPVVEFANNALPEVVPHLFPTLGEGKDAKGFAEEINKLRDPLSPMRRLLPITTNAEVDKLVKVFDAMHGPLPMSGVRSYIQDLRASADANLSGMSATAATKQLGLSQKRAANLLENLRDTAVLNADKYWTLRAQNSAQRARALGVRVMDAEHRVSEMSQEMARTSPSERSRSTQGYKKGLSDALTDARRELAQVKGDLEEAKKVAAGDRQRAVDEHTPERRAARAKYAEDVRKVRVLTAKARDVQAATDFSTGDVDARVLANLQSTKASALSGNLLTLARAGQEFPHLFVPWNQRGEPGNQGQMRNAMSEVATDLARQKVPLRPLLLGPFGVADRVVNSLMTTPPRPASPVLPSTLTALGLTSSLPWTAEEQQ